MNRGNNPQSTFVQWGMIGLLAFFFLLAGDPAWSEFKTWFETEGTPGAPADVLTAYSAKLKERGVPGPEAQGRLQQIEVYGKLHPDEARALHFNRIFTWSAAPFSRRPSEFLKRVASGRKPGLALDIAMGQGRNSLWLATNGWTVSGYDISDEGIRQAQAAAAAAGVKLDTTLASHETFPLGEAKWDLIVMCFAFTKLSDTAYMKTVRDALRPGGVLLVEGFGGGPPRQLNMILSAFLDYRVLVYEELPDVSDWGNMKAPLLRMALEKP